MTDSKRHAVAEALTPGPAAEQEGPTLEDTLRQVLRLAPAAICVLEGPDHRYTFANAAYRDLVGGRDVVGKTLGEALPELVNQGFRELLDEVVRSRKPYMGHEVRVMLQRHPDAEPEEVFVNFLYQPLITPEDRVHGVFVHAIDTTEQVVARRTTEAANSQLRLVQAALANERENLRDLFHQSPLIVAVMRGPEHTFEYVNPAHVRLLQKDATGMPVREAQPEAGEAVFELLDRVYRTGKRVEFKELSVQVGKEERFFDFIYAPRRNAQGEVDGVMALVADITTQVRTRLEAQRANQLKDEFLATVSHELRTPLTAILGWVQMLRGGTLSTQKRELALEIIERNARAQSQLIEDLLDVSRVMSGTLRLDVGTVDLASVVEQAIETVRPAADAKGVRIQSTLDSSAQVMGDAGRLQQIAWNLLSNAVKFTQRAGRVNVLIERRGSSVVLTVADTGQGITAAFLPHVFDRFRQEESGSTRRTGGLGLGLSIVRHLVELHGGRVLAESEGEGKGAMFTVTLPLSVVVRREIEPPPRNRAEAKAADFVCPPNISGASVLVLDDEVDNRELLRAILEQCGAHVTTSESVEDAIEKIQASPPELVVSDVGMPGEDGYAFIEKLRALPKDRGGAIPAVAVTAYARVEDRARLLMAGFQSHVPKPVEPLELLAVLASLRGRVLVGGA